MSHIQKHIFIENDTKEVNKAVFILFEKCWCSLGVKTQIVLSDFVRSQ